jgi:hypothetical protein
MTSEDSRTLERAAKILAQKAELYDKLSSGKVKSDMIGDDRCLVDFEQKAFSHSDSKKVRR